jgi:glycine/serine hydroxymethyltransferase
LVDGEAGAECADALVHGRFNRAVVLRAVGGEAEFRDIGDMVADVLDGLAKNGPENNGTVERQVNERVLDLCARFPIYQG